MCACGERGWERLRWKILSPHIGTQGNLKKNIPHAMKSIIQLVCEVGRNQNRGKSQEVEENKREY